MKRRIPWFELCLLAGVALLGFTIWKSVAPKTPVVVVSDGIPDPATMSPNYRYTGIVVAPVPIKWGGDSRWIAETLDMEMWKFVMKRAGTNSGYRMQLEVREKQKPARVLMTFDQPPLSVNPKTSETGILIVAMMPQNASMASAAKIKCKISAGGSSSSATVDNPFKNHSSSGSLHSSSQPDIPLWETRFGNGYPPSRIRTLFLKIIPKSTVTY